MEKFEISSGYKLFERPPQKYYLDEWTKLLAQPPKKL